VVAEKIMLISFLDPILLSWSIFVKLRLYQVMYVVIWRLSLISLANFFCHLNRTHKTGRFLLSH